MKPELSLALRAWRALPDPVTCDGFGSIPILRLNIDEEKAHRRFVSFGAPRRYSVSVKDAARFQCVAWIARHLQKPTKPDGWRDFFATREGCMACYAAAETFDAEIRAAWQSFDLAALAALDYSEIVK